MIGVEVQIEKCIKSSNLLNKGVKSNSVSFSGSLKIKIFNLDAFE